MKKFIAIAGLIASGIILSNEVSAQATQTKTATSEQVKVNVIFNEILSISVANDQKTVDLIFNTVEDYKNGVEVDKENHLTVISTNKNYEIQVKALDNQFNAVSGGGQLNANQISVAINNQNAQQLDQNFKTLHTVNNALFEQKFNVTYKAKGNEITNNGAIEREYVGKTFTGDVVYSVMTK